MAICTGEIQLIYKLCGFDTGAYRNNNNNPEDIHLLEYVLKQFPEELYPPMSEDLVAEIEATAPEMPGECALT